MIHRIIILLLLCSALVGYAQQDTIYYYADANLKQVDKTQAKLIFKMYPKNGVYIVSKYDDKMVLQQEDTYLDSLLKVKHGPALEYKLGKLSFQGKYKNNLRDGEFIAYDSSGEQTEMSIFRLDTLKSTIFYWPGGSKKEVQLYENSKMVSRATFYGKEETKDEEYTYDSNERILSQIGYYPDGKIGVNETFSKGKLVSASYFDLNGNPTKKFKMNTPPTYPDGIEKVFEIISRLIKYPTDALEMGIHGEVKISFTITEKGKMEDLKVAKKVSPSLDAEALHVVGMLGDWNPGMLHGKPTRVLFTLPVKFGIR